MIFIYVYLVGYCLFFFPMVLFATAGGGKFNLETTRVFGLIWCIFWPIVVPYYLYSLVKEKLNREYEVSE